MKTIFFESLSNITKFTLGVLLINLSFLPSTNASDTFVPTLWGVDEDDGQLFSLGDYTTFGNLEDYGLLKWNNNGQITTFSGDSSSDIEAMTLDANGNMYMALDRILPGVNNPNNQYCATLLSFNIQDAQLDGQGDNIVNVLGAIQIECDHEEDNISGLSIDPYTGNLVALLKNFNSNGNLVADQLFLIDKTDGTAQLIGNIEGLGQRADSGEDIEHAADGSLYVTDDYDNHTYKVNPQTGAIIEVVDTNQTNGLNINDAKFEGLGWDFANSNLVGYEDDHEMVAGLSLEQGNNNNYGTSSMLTDVEGVDFIPTPDGQILGSPNGESFIIFAD